MATSEVSQTAKADSNDHQTETTLAFEAGVLECYKRFNLQRALDDPGKDRMSKLKRSIDKRVETFNRDLPKPKKRSIESFTAQGLDHLKVLIWQDWRALNHDFNPVLGVCDSDYMVQPEETGDVEAPDFLDSLNDEREVDWASMTYIPEEEEPEEVPETLITVVMKDMSNRDQRARLTGEVSTFKRGPFILKRRKTIEEVSVRVLLNGTFARDPQGGWRLSQLHKLNVYGDSTGDLVAKMVATSDLTVEDDRDGCWIGGKLLEELSGVVEEGVRASQAAAVFFKQHGLQRGLLVDEENN